MAKEVEEFASQFDIPGFDAKNIDYKWLIRNVIILPLPNLLYFNLKLIFYN